MFKSKSKTGLTVLFFLSLLVFFLNAYAEEGFHFAVVGDRTGGAQPGVYEKVLAEVNRLNPDIILTVGDFIEGYNQDSTVTNKQWDEYFGLLKELKANVYFTPGNHDIWDKISEINYKNRMGSPYYSFDFKNSHFVILDVSRSEKYEEIPKEQINWLVGDLDKNKEKENIYVFFHKPFWFQTARDNKPDSLHQIFKKYRVDAVFSGHFHNYFAGEKEGIAYTCVGASGATLSFENRNLGQFHQFLWCTVNGNKLDIAVVGLGNILDRSLVTLKEEMVIDKIIDGKCFEFSPILIAEGASGFSGEEKVSIANAGEKVLKDTLRWECQDNWTIAPRVQAMEIEPSQTKDLSFKVDLKGETYPLPKYSFNYPVGEKKVYPIEDRLWIKRMTVCKTMKKSPKIDGKVTDAEWKEITPITSFGSPTGDKTIVEPTKFYFAYDKKNLYLAVKCTESKKDQIVAQAKAQDGAVYAEDCVGYFICPDTVLKDIYQIYFNPLGTPFDQLIKYDGGNYNPDRNWNGKYEVKTFVGEEEWNIEIKIPFSQLKAKPKKGDVWEINFRRKQKRLNSSSDWQYPITYDIKYYGLMRFE
jgi:predicted phosphodiesterase